MTEPASSQHPTLVGPVLLPPRGLYTPTPTRPPVTGPAGQLVAQLERVPDSLSQFVGAAFPPFGTPERPAHRPIAPEQRVSWRIVSVVEYRGTEGRLLVSTVQPSSAALAPGLELGTHLGTLPDGSAIFQMICPDLRHQIRWLQDGFIIALSSDLPLQRLQDLAADVVLRYLRSH